MKPSNAADGQMGQQGGRARLAFLYAVPIGVLGGLIGLGGAEFRLPVLAGPLRYAVRQAVPLNLAVSLVTLVVSLAIRSRTLSLALLAHVAPAIGAMIAGAIITAFVGASVASRLSKQQFERIIVVLLVAIGCALIVEGFLPQQVAALLPAQVGWQVGAGVGFGLAIGLVSSLLGVAGGELIIPTLVFAYGLDIKLAGSASLLISLPTVLVGLARYAHREAFADRRPLVETVAPMGVGSALGAVIGGLLVGVTPASLLKVGLGGILIWSALRMFQHARRDSA